MGALNEQVLSSLNTALDTAKAVNGVSARLGSGREVGGENPGKGYIRVAMVAPTQEMQRGLSLLRDCLYD